MIVQEEQPSTVIVEHPRATTDHDSAWVIPDIYFTQSVQPIDRVYNVTRINIHNDRDYLITLNKVKPITKEIVMEQVKIMQQDSFLHIEQILLLMVLLFLINTSIPLKILIQ